jgi:hypothetical protein
MRRLRRAHQRHTRQRVGRRKKFKQRALAAGTAAVITLGAGASLNKALAQYIPDNHELPVSKDADWDLLADKEEITIGYPLFNPDRNDNKIPDGVELAKRCFTDVNNLPWEQDRTDPNQTYKWWAPQFGLETCDICGAIIGMGPGGVVNPRLGISVQFPFLMTLHYMQHGSLSYAAHYGSEPVQGRLDVPALARALELSLPYEPNDHKLPVAEDADADLLSNKEEFAIGYRLFKSDQNRNEIHDGTDLAMCCAAAVEQLPEFDFEAPPGIKETHKIRYLTDGTESCEICGFTICMDHWDIVNPSIGMKVSLPVMAAHYMEHGSFSYAATYHNGRAHIAKLLRVLELRFPQYWNRHLLPLDYVLEPVGQLAPDANDLDGDLLADSEELALGYNLYNPDQDRDLASDGIELARQCTVVVNELPVYDPNGGDLPPKQTYKVEHEQRGVEVCGICGATRNMGYVEIINPQSGLRIEVPFISIHYMEHGSFSHFGYYQDEGGLLHYGRIDIVLLAKVLEIPRRCGDLGTIYLPGDLNEDCSKNLKDIAEVANRWLGCTDPGRDECDKL